MDVNTFVDLGERLDVVAEQLEAARGYPALGPLLVAVEELAAVVRRVIEAEAS